MRMNPTEIKAVLGELGGGANKRLGQNFLIDRSALETIIETSNIRSGDNVLEIGPGLGVLTRALFEQGANVYAIERDGRYAEYLERWKENNKISNIHITRGDAAQLDWEMSIPTGAWKFVSNLPYSITSFALRKALWSPIPPANLVVLIQREVAERVVMRDKKTSLLSLMVALSSSSVRLVKRVPAGAFFPPPKVESAILQIVPLTWEEREKYFNIHPDRVMELAKRGFAHPRKYLASNLGLSPEQKLILSDLMGSDRVRAEDLSPAQWASLAKALK